MAIPSLLAGQAAFSQADCERQRALAKLPPIIIWAWERPEDLRHLDPQRYAVAFLAETIYIRKGRPTFRPRLQPLHLDEHTKRIAVVRIDTANGKEPISESQILNIAQLVARAAALPNTQALQIDFDAVTSEHDAYKQLLTSVRHLIAKTMPLSITALTSWCIYDNWILQLPVDEIVPMLFQMGRDTHNILSHFKSGKTFANNLPITSFGISLEEKETNDTILPSLLGTQYGSRTYVFSKRPWDIKQIQLLNGLMIYGGKVKP